jgi:TetR/AcrR family transcriptional regulator, transcriptional repressor for nem operon
MPRAARRNTADQILDVAEELVQIRGFNGFSYADVAAKLGVTTAALHYHFASKAELGRALIDRYSTRFDEQLRAIDAGQGAARHRLEAYADIYANVLEAGRMCLCGMLAAEYTTLPKPMRTGVVRFFESNEQWLAEVLRSGESTGSLRLSGTAEDGARAIISGLEGALLVARPFRDVDRFRTTSRGLLAGIAQPRRRRLTAR